jgi:hypothetical protein
MDARAIAKMQPGVIDQVKCLNHPRERAIAIPWRRCRVAILAVEGEGNPLMGQGGIGQNCPVEGMEHQGGIDVGEGAVFD